MKFAIDLDSMTLGELEFFEEQSGITLEEFASGKAPTKATMALIVIQERRTNPKFSMDDARAIRITDIEIEGPNPTKPRRKAAS